MISPDPRLRIRRLSVRYGGVHAVKDMDVDVSAGQVHGLIGPNGAGKTSLIDAVTGFERPSSGTVELDGQDITNWTPHRRVRNGLTRTFQNLELFRDLTIEENLLAAVGSRRDAERTESVAGPLGLADRLGEQVDAVPHGIQRMLTVARALMTEPTVLVLDEPASGLETTEVAALATVLRSIAAEGMAILLVDHDMGLVLEASDVVSVMEFGKLIAHGTPQEIRDDDGVRRSYLGEM